jgi:hypothetical protein
MEFKVGMRFRQIEPIPHTGILKDEDTVFVITAVEEGNIFFTPVGEPRNKGGIGSEVFLKYFEMVYEVEVLPKKPEVVDIPKDSVIVVVGGLFNGIEGVVSKVLEDKVAVRTGDGNVLFIPMENIELKAVPVVEEEVKETFETTVTWHEDFNLRVKLKGKRTTVKIVGRAVEGTVYCCEDDVYDRNIGITKAFNKAIIKLLQKGLD